MYVRRLVPSARHEVAIQDFTRQRMGEPIRLTRVGRGHDDMRVQYAFQDAEEACFVPTQNGFYDGQLPLVTNN